MTESIEEKPLWRITQDVRQRALRKIAGRARFERDIGQAKTKLLMAVSPVEVLRIIDELAEAWDRGYACGLGDYGKDPEKETVAANPYAVEPCQSEA